MSEAKKDDATLVREAQGVIADVLAASTVDEAIAVRTEADAVAACMVALSSIPPHRRKPVIDFLKERFSHTSYLEMLVAVAKEHASDIAEHREEVVRLQREIVALKNDKPERGFTLGGQP